MTEISWPPVLAIGHKIIEIFLQSSIIETLESLSIIEFWLERICSGSVLSQDVQLET